MMTFLIRSCWAMISVLMTLLLLGAATYFYMQSELPDVSALKDVRLQVPMRVFSADHKLMAEYGYKRRIPLQLEDIPPTLVNAVLATEDARYYSHPGVDFIGLARAAKAVILSGKKVQGASTITMQVARNFFLSRKKTYGRKIHEILLAIKIDHELSKDKVLELYLNKVYLGNRAYGVGAAAQIYYGKTVDQLTVAEMAMIAGLPQAPSSNNPIHNPAHALERRNHVLDRMLELQMISQPVYNTAIHAPISAKYHRQKIQLYAPYISQMVRQQMLSQYGDRAEELGLTITTTIDSSLQKKAQQSLKQGLTDYSKRHGYRGPIKNLGHPVLLHSDQWMINHQDQFSDKLSTGINVDQDIDIHHNLSDKLYANIDTAPWLKELKTIVPVGNNLPAVVLSEDDQSAEILLLDETKATLYVKDMAWARPALREGLLGPKVSEMSDVLHVGDMVWVVNNGGHWQLTQIPKVQGAIVSMNPNNGSILALVGGYNYALSNFNRVTQAFRQAGSNFKPFIYSAALAKGYTLASIINDAPIVMKDTGENQLWRPRNDNLVFNGPTRLREGLTKSRNLVSIRLLQDITIPYAVKYVSRFGFDKKDLPRSLSLALGSASMDPLQVVSGFSVFANGGFKVDPNYIQTVIDQQHTVLFQANPPLACEACITNTHLDEAELPDVLAPQVISSQNAYLMSDVLRGVIQTGTGRAAKVLNRSDIAGKTGTTNDLADAWFSGFNSDVSTTVWVGFDNLTSLHEYGSQVALPIWIDFMRTALKGKPLHQMPEPSRIVSVRIDPKTGLLARPGQANAIFESFQQGSAPVALSPSSSTTSLAASSVKSPYGTVSHKTDTVDTVDTDPLF